MVNKEMEGGNMMKKIIKNAEYAKFNEGVFS